MDRVCIVAGTRPEIIKLAPIYKEFQKQGHRKAVWLDTGQHTDLATQALWAFDIQPDVTLRKSESAQLRAGTMAKAPSLAQTLSDLVSRTEEALSKVDPSLVIVQGDTTSAVAAAIASFSLRVPVAHVEAGLRTHDLTRPFPEEGWRRIIAQVSALHYAPTQTAARNLHRSGLPKENILITGNTVIDALQWLRAHAQPDAPIDQLTTGKRLVLVTMHRRENWDEAFTDVCSALIELRNKINDIEICFILHANPVLRRKAAHHLNGQERIHLMEPLTYPKFIQLLGRSTLVLSDSGGIQEEAPAFGVPVLVLRDRTERPEAVTEGVAKLVGTDTGKIVKTATHLLTNEAVYLQMARRVNPFGDGLAASRIIQDIDEFLAARAAKTAA